jgi:hypothetical protein
MTHTPFDNASTSYRPGDFIPQTWRGWDDYTSRLARYEILEGYYHNLAYHKIMQYAQSLKVSEQLYKHVRGVHNPDKRLVEGYVAKVFGGVLDTKNGTTGAIPLQSQNKTLPEAVVKLWVDSHWGQKKSLYVRYGAMKGDSFIKVVDDIQHEHIRIEAVDPAKVKKIEKESDGTITYAEFEYYIRDTDTGFNRLYREVVTPELFQVFTRQEVRVNGLLVGFENIPFSYHTNGRNEVVSEWANDYGFVPLVHVQHTDMGLMFGAPAVHGVLNKINELNDLASVVNDGMRNQVQLPLVTINAILGTLDFGSDQSTNTTADNSSIDTPRKDTMKVLNISGDGADLKALPPTINIADALQNIINIQNEIENDLPELALHRIREGGQLTAPGVRSAYDDAIARFQEARGNYDTGLVAAQKMALAIGGSQGYDGYGGFSLLSLKDGSLDHQIANRPVISDTLGLDEQINLTLQALSRNAPRSIYLKMGWSDDEADEFIASGQTSRNQFMLGMSKPQPDVASAPPNDPNATPDDAFRAKQDTAVNQNDLMNANQLLAVPA